jgi:PhnB protein
MEDVDAVVKKAIDAGALIIEPTENKFYGDRVALLADPYGHRWHVATHIEEISIEEIKKRASVEGMDLKNESH